MASSSSPWGDCRRAVRRSSRKRDVTDALLSEQEAGKITASIFLRYVRLPNRRELLIQRVRSRLFLFSGCGSSLEAAA